MSRSKSVGLLAILLKLLGKGGKLLSFLTKGKVGFGVSTAAWSVMFNWKFAIILMSGMLIHELGHAWAMRSSGIGIRAINFIPFFGAIAVPEEAFRSRREEMFIAIMGPIFGLTVAVILGLGYLIWDNPTLAAGAAFLALVNLFNMIPVSPLDGGRVMKSVAFSIHSTAGIVFLICGLAVAAALLFFGVSYFAAFLIVVGGVELILERQKNRIPRMTGLQTAGSFLLYAMVVAFGVGLMYYMEHVPGADAAMKALRS